MSEVWLVEFKKEGEWAPHPCFAPTTRAQAKKRAKEARFDLIPEYFRIARYVRDEESV